MKNVLLALIALITINAHAVGRPLDPNLIACRNNNDQTMSWVYDQKELYHPKNGIILNYSVGSYSDCGLETEIARLKKVSVFVDGSAGFIKAAIPRGTHVLSITLKADRFRCGETEILNTAYLYADGLPIAEASTVCADILNVAQAAGGNLQVLFIGGTPRILALPPNDSGAEGVVLRYEY